MASAAFVLVQAHRQITREAVTLLDSTGKYLELQLLRIDADLQEPAQFPDFELWKQTHAVSGVCLRYLSANRETSYRLCQGEGASIRRWPGVFETLYRAIFDPGAQLTRSLSFKGRNHGSITVISSTEMELARAWERLTGLLGLSASTTAAVCLLVYLSIYRALRPAQVIVRTLESMQKSDSSSPLPTFKLIEWQRIGEAFNQFATIQKRLLSERKKLALQLMSVQEAERRYLARELHDEFGQCLSAINAYCSSLLHTAKQQCPELVQETESIARINRRMMETVQSLLLRLRPAELDQCGLEASLEAMIREWNQQNAGQSHCRLLINGDAGLLHEPLPINLFRIVQEGLTNIAKHSNATQVLVKLIIAEQSMRLTIEDDGELKQLPSEENQGFGLLGIRERVSGLGGKLDLLRSETGGLSVQVTLPKQRNKTNHL